MNPSGVLHIIDTLAVGGAEQMAINAVNSLPRDRFRPHLCTSRSEGPLAARVASDVVWLRLGRSHRFDCSALTRLISFIRSHDIQIIHAHTTSLFIAVIAAGFTPGVRVIWHDHGALGSRRVFLYRQAVRRIQGLVAVSHPLLRWAIEKLAVREDRAWYIPNFVAPRPADGALPDLPGEAASRIVCVANFRREKDHSNLLKAFSLVRREIPSAQLLLIGESRDREYFEQIQREASAHEAGVTFLGSRLDVQNILTSCSIGVLSSQSEGLPVALIEYGYAGLPAVTTAVGQAAEVVDHGRAGIAVSPKNPDRLAEALMTLLRSPGQRRELGERLRQRVQLLFSQDVVMGQICDVYDLVLRKA